MALSSTEVDRIRYALGYPVTRIGAEPYITYAAVFDKAIIPYLTDVGSTSATAVTAVVAGADVAVTVAINPTLPQYPNGLAFVVGVIVAVDVGPTSEQSIIKAVSGNVLTLTLSNAHGALAPYPIVLAGAEQIIRDILTRLDDINTELRIAVKGSGVQQVDEVQLYANTKGRTKQADKFGALMFQRDQARTDLSDAIGLVNLRTARRGGGGKMELY